MMQKLEKNTKILRMSHKCAMRTFQYLAFLLISLGHVRKNKAELTSG